MITDKQYAQEMIELFLNVLNDIKKTIKDPELREKRKVMVEKDLNYWKTKL